MRLKKWTALAFGFFFMGGCASLTGQTAGIREIREIQEPRYPVYQAPVSAEGSLWSDGAGMELFPDRRARRVGDLVTVRIVEDPEAELNANTKTSRSSDVAAKLKFLGYMDALADKNSRLAQNPGTDDLIKATLANTFDGKGSSDRDGHVKAYVSAVVIGVRPNGHLIINGKREIKVNHETQYITLSGIIRPEDIGPSNEVSSTYVANAKIVYSGIGPVSDKQQPGLLMRVMDHVWPF